MDEFFDRSIKYEENLKVEDLILSSFNEFMKIINKNEFYLVCTMDKNSLFNEYKKFIYECYIKNNYKGIDILSEKYQLIDGYFESDIQEFYQKQVSLFDYYLIDIFSENTYIQFIDFIYLYYEIVEEEDPDNEEIIEDHLLNL